MYNSQYYTCEQIDQRLLQGYLDDYNSQNNTNLTKAEFLTMLNGVFSRSETVDNLVAQIGYYICSTNEDVAMKAVSIPNYSLLIGGAFKIKMAHANTANTGVTLKINTLEAKPLYYSGSPADGGNSWEEGEILEIFYDGTNYQANSGNGSGDGAYDVSVKNSVSGVPATYANLSLALADIPQIKRKGGMTIRFINSTTSKYDHYTYNGVSVSDTDFLNTSNWQGVDEEPTLNSVNLATSGGIYNNLKELNDKIDAMGVSVSLSISQTTIYKATNTSITLTGRMSGGTPTSMKLMDGTTVLNQSTSTPITHSMTVNLTENSKQYKLVGETLGRIFEAIASINARYPIYYGFGANAAAVATNANRVPATTTAVRTYEKTASTNGHHFYILVPTDIPGLTNFTMGGAPFVMLASTETINDVTYRVYTSGNIYNSGTKLTVVAS